MGTAIKHPVPDWVKLSFVIFTSGHANAQPWASECLDAKITNDGLAQNVLCCCRCQVLKSAELVGYFVSADVWSKMVLNNVKMSQSSASLSVVAAVIRGSEPTQLSRHLTEITVVIADPSISHIADVCFAYCTLW